MLSHIRLFAAPWTVTHQAPLPVGFSKQEYWSGVPLPSPNLEHTAGLIITVTTGPPPSQETMSAPKLAPSFPTVSPAPVFLIITSAWPLLPSWKPRKPDLVWSLSFVMMKCIVLSQSFLIWFALYLFNLFLGRLSPLYIMFLPLWQARSSLLTIRPFRLYTILCCFPECDF